MCICTPSKRQPICGNCYPSYNKTKNDTEPTVPTEPRPVLAQIKQLNGLGMSSWYEVVYYDGENWAAYAGSDTFRKCEQVAQWKYVTELMPSA